MPDRTPLALPPGVARQGSEAEMQGRWYMSQLVRWVNGVMRPVGGWEKIATSAPFVGPIRATHVWTTREGLSYIGVLTETHLYVVDRAGTVTDITPTGGITGPADTTVGGYGDFDYSDGLYGTPRPDKPDTRGIGPMWSLDNWGDDLLAMASTDGRLLRWVAATPATPAAVVPPDDVAHPAPQGRFFVVTPERHVMVFWNGDKFNQFAWCSQEQIGDWDYSDTTNSAGFYDIEPASPFITAVSTRFGVLAFTAVGAYFIRYLGTPYFYSYEFLGAYSAPVAGGAIASLADVTLWYASDGFWAFDGNTVRPVACDVLDWIQRRIDPIWQYRRMTAIYLGMQTEVWFFFPEEGQHENNRYVIYNPQEKWWSMGKLSRTCGTPGSALTYPLMTDGASLFLHEKGLFYYDAPELPYAQSAGIQIADGARSVTARRGLVDTRAPAGDVEFYVTGRRDRISDGTEIPDLSGRLPVRRNGGKLDFRVTGRDLIIRIQSTRSGVEPWTFGKFMCALAPRGGR